MYYEVHNQEQWDAIEVKLQRGDHVEVIGFIPKHSSLPEGVVLSARPDSDCPDPPPVEPADEDVQETVPSFAFALGATMPSPNRVPCAKDVFRIPVSGGHLYTIHTLEQDEGGTLRIIDVHTTFVQDASKMEDQVKAMFVSMMDQLGAMSKKSRQEAEGHTPPTSAAEQSNDLDPEDPSWTTKPTEPGVYHVWRPDQAPGAEMAKIATYRFRLCAVFLDNDTILDLESKELEGFKWKRVGRG